SDRLTSPMFPAMPHRFRASSNLAALDHHVDPESLEQFGGRRATDLDDDGVVAKRDFSIVGGEYHVGVAHSPAVARHEGAHFAGTNCIVDTAAILGPATSERRAPVTQGNRGTAAAIVERERGFHRAVAAAHHEYMLPAERGRLE